MRDELEDIENTLLQPCSFCNWVRTRYNLSISDCYACLGSGLEKDVAYCGQHMCGAVLLYSQRYKGFCDGCDDE